MVGKRGAASRARAGTVGARAAAPTESAGNEHAGQSADDAAVEKVSTKPQEEAKPSPAAKQPTPRPKPVAEESSCHASEATEFYVPADVLEEEDRLRIAREEAESKVLVPWSGGWHPRSGALPVNVGPPCEGMDVSGVLPKFPRSHVHVDPCLQRQRAQHLPILPSRPPTRITPPPRRPSPLPPPAQRPRRGPGPWQRVLQSLGDAAEQVPAVYPVPGREHGECRDGAARVGGQGPRPGAGRGPCREEAQGRRPRRRRQEEGRQAVRRAIWGPGAAGRRAGGVHPGGSPVWNERQGRACAGGGDQNDGTFE